MIYAFDLDSTLTKCETLPYLANLLNISAQYEKVIKDTKDLPYTESLKKRLVLFQNYPAEEISRMLSNIPIFPLIQNFILSHSEDSCIITSNIDCYVEDLAKKFGCKVFAGKFFGKEPVIIQKEEIIKELQKKDKVVFTGDGSNDAPALKMADFSFAASYAKNADKNAIVAADKEVFSELELMSCFALL